jgi:hypothetical protein
MNRWKIAWLKTLSALTVNLSAGWFAVLVIVPNFAHVGNWDNLIVLFYDLMFGTIFLVSSVWLEKISQFYE